MRKVTQKFLRELVKDGYAKVYNNENITNLASIGYSIGLYGCNGIWFTGSDGNDYVIIGRKSALFKFMEEEV